MDADGNHPAPAAQPVNLKIPDFHGLPSKDSTAAQRLIQLINNLSKANNWDTSVSFHQFAIALKSSAQKWLEWQMATVEGAVETWEWIEPRFRKEFVTQIDDANILDLLAHLKIQHDESVLDLYSRIYNIRRILNATKNREVTLPQANAQGFYTEEQMRDVIKKADTIYADHIHMQLFKHALPVDIKLAVNLANPTTSEQAYNIANMQYKTMQANKQISDITEDNKIDAVRPNFRPQSNFRQTNSFQRSNNQSNQRSWQQCQQQQNVATQAKPFKFNNQRPGNNSNRNGIICVYCKKQGHKQEDCRNRIKDNAPCVSNNGKPFYPKRVVSIFS